MLNFLSQQLRWILLSWLLLQVYFYRYSSSSYASSGRGNPFYQCVETILSLTQSCANENKGYATLMAMYSNRRLVFVRSKRPWEYDCPNQAAWGCFFSFDTCPDAIVNSSQIDISNFASLDHYPRKSGSDFIVRKSMINYSKGDALKYLTRFNMLLKNAYFDKLSPHELSICDESKVGSKDVNVTILAGLLANHLYRVREETMAAIDNKNKPFYKVLKEHQVPSSPWYSSATTNRKLQATSSTATKPYLVRYHRNSNSTADSSNAAHPTHPFYHYASIQLRLQDKQYETPGDIWPKVSNMSHIALQVLHMLQDYISLNPNHPPLTHIFLATDNCTAAGELASYLHKYQDMGKAVLPAFSTRHLPPSFVSPMSRGNGVSSSASKSEPSATQLPQKPAKFFFLGACFAADGISILKERQTWNPREDSPSVSSSLGESGNFNAKTLLLMSDIEMLRYGAVFMGSFYSNFVRTIHYLRSMPFRQQHWQFSYHLLADDNEFQDRLNMKEHF